jgi:hypothetical protein
LANGGGAKYIVILAKKTVKEVIDEVLGAYLEERQD